MFTPREHMGSPTISCVVCFVCLRSLYYAQWCLCFWIVHTLLCLCFWIVHTLLCLCFWIVHTLLCWCFWIVHILLCLCFWIVHILLCLCFWIVHILLPFLFFVNTTEKGTYLINEFNVTYVRYNFNSFFTNQSKGIEEVGILRYGNFSDYWWLWDAEQQ